MQALADILGWAIEAVMIWGECEGWKWTVQGRDYFSLGHHDEPPTMPEELLELILNNL